MGRCCGDSHIAICRGHRDCYHNREKGENPQVRYQGYESGQTSLFRAYVAFCHDIAAAVGNESGNPCGAGNREQLRLICHGSFRSRCEDRQYCLYAIAGIRKRVLDIRQPERRSG